MSDACAIRPVATRDLAAAEPELLHSALALSGCDRFEIVIGRYEHESAGLRFDSWHPEIRRRLEQELAAWQSRNADRALRAITTSATVTACVMVVHHARKG